MNATARPVVLVENDPFPRLLQAFLAAEEDAPHDHERSARIAEFLAHDEPDYAGWLARARAAAPGLYPAEVVLVDDEAALHAALPRAHAVVTESLRIGPRELALAPQLRVVQKYGTVLRNIDAAACRAHDVAVLTLRRRANVACAEHAYALLLALTRRLDDIDGLVSFEHLHARGFPAAMFDTRHTPNSNWARIGGLRTVYGLRAGILGLGEIGREVATRALAFGMTLSYHQRTPLTDREAAHYQAEYRSLDDLLRTSDVVFVTLPSTPATRGLLGARELALMKRDALLINVSRAAIVDRHALLAALTQGRLGGLGLDAYYDEPARPDDPLLTAPRAVFTPRVAAQPRHNALADLAQVMAQLAAALA